jgi:outer membrane protein OmpA-like peptidoglycan-associated protein
MIFRILLCLCLLYYLPAPAQQKQAQRKYHQALKLRAQKRNDKAFALMHRVIATWPSYEEPYVTLGAWYFQSHRYRQAAEVYRQASSACPNGDKNFARLFAASLLYSGQPEEALRISNIYGGQTEEWKKLKSQISFVQRAMARPWPYPVVNMGPRINTPHTEMFPHMAVDGQSLFFTRRTNGIDEDLYRADADSCGGWFAGKPLQYPLNTSSQEAAQTISADRHYMFFMRCENRSPNGWAQGGCDLYMSYTPDTGWSVPQSFGATINTPGYEGMPCLSPDNRVLYFASDREGGYGGLDIWMSRFEGGLWQEPRNLGPQINTPGNETAPFLYADNKLLLFASDGHPGMGGSDLFMSRRINDSSWSPAVNLGYPVNTTADEISICLSADAKKAWFASNRDSLEGNYDLYETEWPAMFQPEAPVTFINGRVYDSLSGRALNYASIFLHDLQGNEIAHYTSNRGDGSFMIIMPVGATYLLSVYRVGYLSLFDTLHYSEQYLAEPATYHAALLPQDYQRPMTDTLVMEVFFRMNSKSLDDTARSRIRETLKPWAGREDIYVLVNGYTDNVGTPLINEQLSYYRAGLVAQELSAMGIPKELISAQGWGEANPVTDNDTEANRDRNRRVEIIIRQ